MNFLYRSQAATPSPSPEVPVVAVPESDKEKAMTMTMGMGMGPPAPATLEGLIAAEDPFPGRDSDGDNGNSHSDDSESESNESRGRTSTSTSTRNDFPFPDGKHADVSPPDGCITIPRKELELPDDWNQLSDLAHLHSLDRSFLFPGEQLHILVCLSASALNSQSLSPFQPTTSHSLSNPLPLHHTNLPTPTQNGHASTQPDGVQNEETNAQVLSQPDNQKKQADNILQRFRNSSFFARIAQSDDPLWSRKKRAPQGETSYNAVSDKGFFDSTTAGGVARDAAKCFLLSNGDIVVLLRVNVGITNSIPDPILEVLQFEKCQWAKDTGIHSSDPYPIPDPCHELLTWLHPLDRTLAPPRSISPPVNPPAMTHKPSFSSSSTSQIFSFSNFRSYSMPTMPPVTAAPPPPSVNNMEEFDNVSLDRSSKGAESGEGKLSFRGVMLETERYSVRAGLEGVYLPGKRWRKRVEIVQPVEVHSFAAKCTTENLLCVQVKNVAPEHLSDIIIYVDALTIVFEETSKNGTGAGTCKPLSLPIASIEAGDGHCLPNIALRRGEEHSFILKPATTLHRDTRGGYETNSSLLNSRPGSSSSNLPLKSRVSEPKSSSSSSDRYAILVSYRCNYSESKLFFKQATSWRPSVARDVMISVSSEPYNQVVRQSMRVPQLPVQVLTLEATNHTPEDLTLTVLAPEPSASSPSVVPLNSAPTAPAGSSFSTESTMEGNGIASCSHLWLQSAVPLGSVPAQSSATVKLELLPLTDGIITLNTLQVTIKEKGVTYVPEHSLEIYATSSISTGIS
ncbi:heat-inducible transcription repressor [Rhynchospora pubera]|uniref:Heat-inducible transcription repressor n=1 Tax=Rhynchospora pubera TaxID=906938 RepID=A0AAV8EF14_9POAL|nr:heat-inducible transcription repressor [Rhynchospora pubera]KAJ4779833.1 heat-inducible transcription repressor [Rhynchospora pubera]